MVGEVTAFFASDWLEGLSFDWLFDLCVCVRWVGLDIVCVYML